MRGLSVVLLVAAFASLGAAVAAFATVPESEDGGMAGIGDFLAGLYHAEYGVGVAAFSPVAVWGAAVARRSARSEETLDAAALWYGAIGLVSVSSLLFVLGVQEPLEGLETRVYVVYWLLLAHPAAITLGLGATWKMRQAARRTDAAVR